MPQGVGVQVPERPVEFMSNLNQLRNNMVMNKKQCDYWARTRQQGKSRYVLLKFVFIWGLVVAILWTLVMSLLMKWNFWYVLPSSLIIFPIAGYFVGKMAWDTIEKEYLKSCSSTETKVDDSVVK